MSYRQLTQEQRYQIGAYLKMGKSKSEIAREIQVHRSTVWRELKRNSTPYRYNPSHAIGLSRERHKKKKKREVDKRIWATVEMLIRQEWSPEQISERLKLEGLPVVSHETIYQHVYRDKQKGGTLCMYLRRRHVNRKRIHKYCNRVGWNSRRPIAERPAIVDARSRIGDWEADTIIGRERKGGILSLVERRSRFCLLKKLSTKAADIVADAACEKLMPFKDKVLTITADNGVEFIHHQSIAKRLDADFFFADPYSSWQRGTVENTNGLVRQYFPKNTAFDTVSDDDIDLVVHRLNNRPRKTLHFRTPSEVFFNHFVALIT